MKIITFGGWYQRTTLHLTEVYKFLVNADSNLELSKEKLEKLRKDLDLKSTIRKPGYLEYIEIITNSGIKIKYYEDGLYLLEINEKEIEKDSKRLKEYFNEKFKPAIDYLFSLGAPTPKILSNIKDDHPIVVGDLSLSPRRIKLDEKVYGKVYAETISRNAHVFKTNKYIVAIVSKQKKKELEPLIEMQIFFREFKLQLHKYLDIHRKIWEEISDIKEEKAIQGKNIGEYRSKLDSYQKTIRLIGNRINQMGTYAKTRASLSKNLGIENELVSHFEYKYEDLFNSLEYIKEIWKMTSDYVDSAIQIMKEIREKASFKGVKSIQLLASIGVVTGILRLMNPKAFPVISFSTAIYILGLGIIAFGIDWIMRRNARNKRYDLKFVERSKDI